MASRAWKPNELDWEIAAAFAGADGLARAAGTTPLVAQLLHNRGIEQVEAARAFLKPQLTDLHDPTLLPGAVEAAERIARAVADKQRIVLYGDYDVDGITGVAILHACLAMVGAQADYYVPHRIDEGYGLNAEAVDKLIADGAQLLITVDCGISAVEPVARATAAGVDVIVTDHHAPPPELPRATVIVHPGVGGTYPNANLAGAGVAFKLAWQVARQICGEKRVDEPMRNFLLEATSLAALGTIADVVPLVGENRALAVFGLRGLPATQHAGLHALLDSAGLLGEKLDAYHMGFRLAPRLNAAGRMGHARLAVELLTRAQPQRAAEIAAYLDKQNTQRRQVEREIADQAMAMVAAEGLDAPEHRVIVLGSEDWHGGVVGIVASRLVDRYDKPAVLIAMNGPVSQGSGRSTPGFDMSRALAACGEHLVSFGGHAMAGGVRIERQKLADFAGAMEAWARDESGNAPTGRRTLRIDAETALADLDYRTVVDIQRMAPFGQGNPAAVVALRGCRVLNPPRRMGRGGRTVGMVLGQNGASLRVVGFAMGDLADLLVGVNHVDVVGEPVLNTYRGRTTVELHLLDVAWGQASAGET